MDGGEMHRKFLILLLLSLWLSFLATPSLTDVLVAPPAQAGTREYQIHVSARADRGRSVQIETAGVLSGKAYIFVTPTAGIRQVRFFMDPLLANLENPSLTARPFHTAERAPFDLNGIEGRWARPFETAWLLDGPHTLVAALDMEDGRTEVKIARTMVHNGPRSLLFAAEPVKFAVQPDSRGAKAVRLLTSDFAAEDYTLTSDAPWLSFGGARSGVAVGKGTAPSFHTVEVDATGMRPGTYSARMTATADGLKAASKVVTMEVTGSSACTPLGCSQVLVRAPYTLDFNRSHGKITDKAGVGTGFTYVNGPVHSPGTFPANLQVNTAGRGTLSVTTTKGVTLGTASSLDNALAVGVDASNQILLLDVTLLNPPPGADNYEQVGLWFGNDDDNHVKIQVLSGPGATRIQYVFQSGGVRTAWTVSGPLLPPGPTINLRLRANPRDRVVAAYYSTKGDDVTWLGQFIVPDEYFSLNSPDIDPRIGTRSFAGVLATQRYSDTPLVYEFDRFSVAVETVPATRTRTATPAARIRTSTPAVAAATATSQPPLATNVPLPATSAPPTATRVPPTATAVPRLVTPIPPTATRVPATATIAPPPTLVPPTATSAPPPTLVPPTATSAPPTMTPVPPTATSEPPTMTPVPPTATSEPPTVTPIPPTATSEPPTVTPVPPAATSTPKPTKERPNPTRRP
jgi:hypothetical protein